jgi:hypothetical protein
MKKHKKLLTGLVATAVVAGLGVGFDTFDTPTNSDESRHAGQTMKYIGVELGANDGRTTGIPGSDTDDSNGGGKLLEAPRDYVIGTSTPPIRDSGDTNDDTPIRPCGWEEPELSMGSGPSTDNRRKPQQPCR